MDPVRQADEVRKVKKFESGMVVNPLTIHPDQTLADALELMEQHEISGFPVVERGSRKLVGILTNRDVRFASDRRQKVSELMTKDRLITVKDGVVQHDEAKRLLHQYRIEKLLVVDERLSLRRPHHRARTWRRPAPSRMPARTSRAACASPRRSVSARTG